MEEITDEELDLCVRIVGIVAKSDDVQNVRFRPLRKALEPLIWKAMSRDGYEANREIAKKAHRRALNREKQRAQAFAKAAADRATLRKDRSKRLTELAAANASHDTKAAALMVPDGYVADDSCVDKRLTAANASHYTKAAVLMVPDGYVADDSGVDKRLTATDASHNTKAAVLMVPDGYVADDSGVDNAKNVLDTNRAMHYTACYSCRTRFCEIHFFYGSAFCPTCALLNWTKRNQTCDANQRTALVTGARIKIGHCVALKLLRAGAKVFTTSRFPTDALERFQQASDYIKWQHRLEVIGIDFRDLSAVCALANYIDRNSPDGLDILINNACQTVRRPRSAYANLIAKEAAQINNNQAKLTHQQQTLSTEFMPIVLPQDLATTAELATSFPLHCVDAAGQQLDIRDTNSWKMTLADVPLSEAAECFAVNTLAPLALTSQLKPAMLRNRADRSRFIVQVSAMEAKFNRIKTIYHPHTNAAKSALNQIVRTSAADYANDHIYMNAVDTGWVNDERPLPQASRIHRESGFQTPIDEIDAAARILDPIFSVINGSKEPFYGFFLKDYEPTDW